MKGGEGGIPSAEPEWQDCGGVRVRVCVVSGTYVEERLERAQLGTRLHARGRTVNRHPTGSGRTMIACRSCVGVNFALLNLDPVCAHRRGYTRPS
jgi:hypothetical protein